MGKAEKVKKSSKSEKKSSKSEKKEKKSEKKEKKSEKKEKKSSSKDKDKEKKKKRKAEEDAPGSPEKKKGKKGKKKKGKKEKKKEESDEDDEKEEDAVQILKKTLTGKRKEPESESDGNKSSSGSSSDSESEQGDDGKEKEKEDSGDTDKGDDDDDEMVIHEKAEPINSNVDAETAKKNEGNCKLFLSNLSWDLTDEACKEFFADCGEIVDIYWFEDRETGQFRGMGKVTFDTPENAIKALKKQDQDFLGRPLNIKYSEDKRKDSFGGGGAGKPKFQSKPLSPKPEGCVTVFCGNLSYDIDDNKMCEFFKECGEINKVRWLTDRESGDFKGCGFVEFYDESAPDAAVKLNGKDLMGRAIRIDYASSNKK